MALPSMNSDAHWNTSVPGRITISTPKKATMIAMRRLGVMRSPSIGQASRATKNGVVKLMEAALASGRYFTPVKKHSIDIRCTPERMICHLSVTVRISAATPKRGVNRARMNTRCEAARAHTTCSVL